MITSVLFRFLMALTFVCSVLIASMCVEPGHALFFIVLALGSLVLLGLGV